MEISSGIAYNLLSVLISTDYCYVWVFGVRISTSKPQSNTMPNCLYCILFTPTHTYVFIICSRLYMAIECILTTYGCVFVSLFVFYLPTYLYNAIYAFTSVASYEQNNLITLSAIIFITQSLHVLCR